MPDTVSANPPQGLEVDLERLLAPISAEQPAGKSLRYEKIYDKIEDLRREDDPSLPQGVWKHKLKKADWPKVASLCLEALETRTKDLRIAGWLFEAWVHLHGLAAVEPGFKLLHGLAESFWDNLYPAIEDDDLEPRLAPFEWIDAHLALPIKSASITRPEGQDAPAYGWVDWERALYLAQQAHAETISSDEVTREKVEVSVTLTPDAFYHALATTLDTAETALAELIGILTDLAGDAAPRFLEIHGTLKGLRGFADKVFEQRAGGDVGLGTDGEAGERPPAGDEEAAAVISGGRIRSRAEAYRSLNLAAEYLLRTEPHSPAPYLVKRAVTWGNMPLADLYKELLQGGADLKTIYTLLGIREEPQ